MRHTQHQSEAHLAPLPHLVTGLMAGVHNMIGVKPWESSQASYQCPARVWNVSPINGGDLS